jgi:hypothetical protein
MKGNIKKEKKKKKRRTWEETRKRPSKSQQVDGPSDWPALTSTGSPEKTM